MTKEQALEKLIDQINNDMAVFVGILAIVLAAFLYFQWRLSDKQILKMKQETSQELERLYHFDQMQNTIDELSNKLSSAEQEVISLKRKVEKLRSATNDNKQSISSLLKTENEIKDIPNKINIDPTEINFSLEKTLLESDIISLMYTDSDNESKRLSNGIKDKIENLMRNEAINDFNKRIFLMDILNKLSGSDNEAIRALREYLHQKYRLI